MIFYRTAPEERPETRIRFKKPYIEVRISYIVELYIPARRRRWLIACPASGGQATILSILLILSKVFFIQKLI